MNMKPKGGVRPGAGRPRKNDEPMVSVTVYIPARLVAEVIEHIGGNLSNATRDALSAAVLEAQRKEAAQTLAAAIAEEMASEN